jgi:hypothetical protein
MNCDPIIQIAWNAGLSQFVGNKDQSEELKRFATLVAAAERNAIIAKLLEIGALEDGEFIAAIHARGEQE